MKFYTSIFLFTFLLSQEVFDGYTLYTPQTNQSIQTSLMNNDFQTIHTWTHERALQVCLI